MFYPVPGDFFAGADPDPVVTLHMIEESREAGSAGGPPCEPVMKAERHHFGFVRTFRVEHVERVLHVVEKIVGGRETGMKIEAVSLVS